MSTHFKETKGWTGPKIKHFYKKKIFESAFYIVSSVYMFRFFCLINVSICLAVYLQFSNWLLCNIHNHDNTLYHDSLHIHVYYHQTISFAKQDCFCNVVRFMIDSLFYFILLFCRFGSMNCKNIPVKDSFNLFY